MRGPGGGNAAWTLVALFVGLGAGIAADAAAASWLPRAVAVVEPIGTLWINAIRMTVVPLVVSLLVVGVAGTGAARLGRLGARAIPLFVVLLVASGAFTAVVAPPLLARVRIDPAVAASLREGAAASAGALAENVRRLPDAATRIAEIVPANAVRAAAEGAMLPLVVFTLTLAVALTRLPDSARARILPFFEGTGDAMLVIVGWVLAVAPIGNLALAFVLGARMGGSAAGAIAWYVVVLSACLFVVTLMLYPVAVLAGRVPARRFAAAVAPAQAVAFSSRSSLAALPALIAGARERLGLGAEATSVVLPFAVTMLRINVPIAWVVGIAFLAQLYGVPVDAVTLASVLLTSVLLSFSVPGLPSASLFLLAPVLVSYGLPAEGVGILIAVDAVPDMFKTLANVTAYMTSTAIIGGALDRPAAPGDSSRIRG
ncbi:MAG TPA: cation:dicarboxylase symporter family transporter [Gemmatimonadaceae bacterium]|nr:cation:dicarboxylase symporter family transporter [Gemmatimonadaceae bacterium]